MSSVQSFGSRVVFVVSDFPVLSQTFVTLQIAELTSRGIHVDVINSGKIGRDTVALDSLWSGISVYQTQTPAGKKLRKLKVRVFLKALFFACTKPAFLKEVFVKGWLRNGYKLFAEVITYGYSFRKCDDVTTIHSQFANLVEPVITLRELGFFKTRPVVFCSVRGFDVTSDYYVKKTNWNRVFDEVDVFLPVCDALGVRLKQLGYKGEMRVVHSPIDVMLAQSVQVKDQSRVEKCVYLVSVGRLVEKKGIGDALKAVVGLKKSGIFFRYTIVGDGPMRGELQNFIDQNGLQNEVVLVGAMQPRDVLSTIAQCDVFLAPCKVADSGDMEGIPNVLKEAMFFGLQVIGTRHSGIPELVRDGENGYLVDEGRSDQVYKVLVEIIRNSENWVEIACKAKLSVDKFNPKVTTDELVQVYHEFSN